MDRVTKQINVDPADSTTEIVVTLPSYNDEADQTVMTVVLTAEGLIVNFFEDGTLVGLVEGKYEAWYTQATDPDSPV